MIEFFVSSKLDLVDTTRARTAASPSLDASAPWISSARPHSNGTHMQDVYAEDRISYLVEAVRRTEINGLLLSRLSWSTRRRRRRYLPLHAHTAPINAHLILLRLFCSAGHKLFRSVSMAA